MLTVKKIYPKMLFCFKFNFYVYFSFSLFLLVLLFEVEKKWFLKKQKLNKWNSSIIQTLISVFIHSFTHSFMHSATFPYSFSLFIAIFFTNICPVFLGAENFYYLFFIFIKRPVFSKVYITKINLSLFPFTSFSSLIFLFQFFFVNQKKML